MNSRSGYGFKRSFFFDAQRAIEKTAVSFILGPRKCGKTVCLNQLADYYDASSMFDTVVYADAKNDYTTQAEKIKLKSRIINDIRLNHKTLYLIDEATYLDNPDATLGQIRSAYSQQPGRNTRIVFTGSQSTALGYWARMQFSGCASLVQPTFLSYPEWLAYKGISEVSAKTYFEFINGTREFYQDFVSVKDYLFGCLHETVTSNNNPEETVPSENYYELTDEMLLDVLYGTLFSLHNSGSYASFARRDALSSKLITHFSERFSITSDVVNDYVSEFLKERYNHLKEMTAIQLFEALKFLDECGLITITPEVDSLEKLPKLDGKIAIRDDGYYNKEILWLKNNICISYPMFFVDIMQDVLGTTLTDAMPHSILGSIVECHVRGLLPNTHCVEYRSSDTYEVDYINTAMKTAVEITIADKKPKNVHFEKLQEHESYRKILLTASRCEVKDKIEYVPYFRFIFDNSPGKELLSKDARPNTKFRKRIITPSMYQKTSTKSKKTDYGDDD